MAPAKSLLQLGIGLLSDVVKRNKGSIPVLRAINVIDRDGQRIAVASDLNIWVEVPIEDTHAPGLYEIVGKNLLKSSMKVDRFPELPYAETEWLPGHAVFSKEVAEAVASKVSNEESRYTLNGMLVEASDKYGVTLVATDDHRLHVHQQENSNDLPVGKHLVPSGAIALAIKHTKAGNAFNLQINQGNKFLRLTVTTGTGALRIFTRPLSGNFPNYELVIPREFPIHISFNKIELNEVLTQAKDYVKGNRSKTISITVKEDGETSFYAKMQDSNHIFNGTAVATVEQPITKNFSFRNFNNDLTIIMPIKDGHEKPKDFIPIVQFALDHDYLTNAIKHLQGDRVYIGIKDAQTAFTLSGTSFNTTRKVETIAASVEHEDDYAYLRRAS